ncbi:uncharacterized protein LOC143887655 [Tasmannia lanceolata]|uniref:uncharacterized protein LOC143887655 n=1 Tax=Tasmannia lanceolata TaxID=3420 RepID=UPI004062FA1B
MEELFRLREEFRRTGGVLPMAPYSLSMNGHFVREGETSPYYGFSEPWYDSVTGIMVPGFEIFTGLALPKTEPPVLCVDTAVEDWLVYLEPGLLESLYEEEEPTVDWQEVPGSDLFEEGGIDSKDVLVAAIQSDSTFAEPQSQIAPTTEGLSTWSSDVIPTYLIAKSSPVKSVKSVLVPSLGESFSDFIYNVSPEPV